MAKHLISKEETPTRKVIIIGWSFAEISPDDLVLFVTPVFSSEKSYYKGRIYKTPELARAAAIEKYPHLAPKEKAKKEEIVPDLSFLDTILSDPS